MSLTEDDRKHRRFFSTHIPPPQKPAEMFPTASPKALIHVRSGLYDYPEPCGDEDDLILGYRNYSTIKISPRPQSRENSVNSSRASAYRTGAPASPNRSGRNLNSSLNSSFYDGSPSELRLAREHAASRYQSLSGLSNISQMAAQRKQGEQSRTSFYTPSGLF